MTILEAPRTESDRSPGFEPRYDLTDTEAQSLTFDLLNDQRDKIPADKRFVCVRIKGSSRFSNIGRKVEADVFLESFNDDNEEMVRDFDQYEEQSYFHVVVDTEECQPVGALRIIENGPNGLKTLNDIAEPDLFVDSEKFFEDYSVNPNKTWDVGTVAVNKDYRSRTETYAETTGLLYRALYAGARENDIDHFVSLIHPKALKKILALGIPFKNIYPEMPAKVYYDGTVWQQVVANVADFDTEMRGFAQAKIDRTSNDTLKSLAYWRLDYIDKLLTGNALDDMMAFRHKGIHTDSVS